MANTQFVLTDRVDPIDYTVTLTNAPDTASGYTAANIFTRDRHTIWKVGSTNVGTFDIDLGSASSLSTLVVCGESHIAWGSAAGPLVTFFYSADGVAWTNTTETIAAATWTATVTNAVIQLDAAASARYWRIVFTGTDTFSIGKVFLANATDMGFVYAQGTTRTLVRQRTRHNVNGAIAIHELGPAYRRFGLRFDKIGNSTLSTLETLHGLGRPFVYIDKASHVYHVELDDDLLTCSHVAGDASNDWYDTTLNLVEIV